MNPKLLRITTVPQSLDSLLSGQLRFMKGHDFKVVGVSSSGPKLDKVKQEQEVEVVAIEMSRVISPIQDLKALWQFYKLCKKEKPTMVHSHTPKAGIVGMLGAKLAGVPIRLHTVAGLPLMEATGFKRKILNWVEKLTYACATIVYPNSKGLKDFILQEKFTHPEKVKIIGYGSSNGIDTGQFDPNLITEKTKLQLRKELEIKKEDFVFLFVGRVVADKGINELVQAFINLISNLQSPTSNPHLILVGNYENHLDPLKPKIEKLINEHPNIHAVGYKTNVEEYFAMADVLTFPSYREGFPNVVMQAAAMQLNAIVSDINGCNEIISNGNNGWIVPVKDIERLKERMLWSYEHREQSEAMGQKSRKLIQEKYERQYVWSELLKEYRRLAKQLGN